MGQTTKAQSTARRGESESDEKRKGGDGEQREEGRKERYVPSVLIGHLALDANPCLLADCRRIKTFAFAFVCVK